MRRAIIVAVLRDCPMRKIQAMRAHVQAAAKTASFTGRPRAYGRVAIATQSTTSYANCFIV